MWPNPQFSADLVTFTEEILNGKLHFLCSVSWNYFSGFGKKFAKSHNFFYAKISDNNRSYMGYDQLEVLIYPKLIF